MEAIEQSRVLNNLRRDLKANFKEDETLSILNLSGREIEVTDTHTGITKIVYPRSVFHTNRPKSNLLIEQFADIPEKYSDQKIDKSSPKMGKFSDQKIYRAILPRNKIRKNFISIETPIKYKDEIGNYAELLSMRWIGKILETSDSFIITPFSNYMLYNDKVTSNAFTVLMFILIIIAAIALSVLGYLVIYQKI